MAPLQEQILATLHTLLTPQEVWGTAGEMAEEYPEYVLDELPQSSPPTTNDFDPPCSPDNSLNGSSSESNSCQGFSSVSTHSEWETLDKGFQEFLSADPPSSEPGLKVTDKIENTNVSDVNKVNSSGAEPSKTFQVEDKAEDPGGDVNHPSLRGGGSTVPPGGDTLSQEVQHLPDSQTLGRDCDDAFEKWGSADNVSEAESKTEVMSR